LPKNKTVTRQQRKAIRSYVKQGLSSNKIQKSLQRRNLGLRRKVLLEEIRKVKNRKPKVNAYKYTPKKYRRVVSEKYGYPAKKRRFAGRQVAVYGYAKTMRHPRAYSARFEFYGSGKELRQAVRLAHNGIVPHFEHAFVKCSARDFLNSPSSYGERGVWVARPNVDS
jgi:hypothetical protein